MLGPHHQIAFIAPSFPVPEETGRRGQKLLDDLGLKSVVMAALGREWGLYAGSVADRVSSLQKAMAHDNVGALWALRGGAGCRALMPTLLSMPKPQHKKWIIGFSDITALLHLAQHHWGWPTLHAPNVSLMVNQDYYTKETKAIFGDVITGRRTDLTYPLAPLGRAAFDHPILTGPVTGGNLSVLQYSIGTPFPPQTRNHILFLEDVNERAYRIDQILEHYHQSGVFQGIKALFLGDFTFDSAIDQGEEIRIDDMLVRFAEQHPTIPMYRLRGIGHGKRNLPLPFGIEGAILYGKGGQPSFHLSIPLTG